MECPPPPAEATDIGGNHRIEIVYYQGEPAGFNEWHLNKKGAWCRGWVAFKQSKWGEQFKKGDVGWNVQVREPLTLSPSIKCRACEDHWHMVAGKWSPTPAPNATGAGSR
jgi:hypothetical protein